jgi:hypothetical protein
MYAPRWNDPQFNALIPAPRQFLGLGAMGSANQLNVEMPDRTIRIFYSITQDLGNALAAGGRPQRPYDMSSYNTQSPQWGVAPNGYYIVTQFQGGYLLDNCPLNVIFGQGWIAGQQEALATAGLVAHCPQILGTNAPMVTVLPQQQIPSLQFPGATFSPTPGPAFAITSPSGVIPSGQGTPAPVTAVSSQGGSAPPPVTDVFQDMGPGSGAGEASSGMPSWVPYAAAALIVAVLLRR